jgi:hypothetical protein
MPHGCHGGCGHGCSGVTVIGGGCRGGCGWGGWGGFPYAAGLAYGGWPYGWGYGGWPYGGWGYGGYGYNPTNVTQEIVVDTDGCKHQQTS